MAVETLSLKEEKGQSVLEFLFVLPALVGMTVILVRINTAIQISIVDQQYARAQTHALAFNSPFYPSLNKQKRLVSTGTNQLIVGVSDNQATGDSYTPKATVQAISRSKRVAGSDAAKEEPTSRSLVRIRNSVTLCTQTLTLGGSRPILQLSPDGNSAEGLSALNEGVTFNNLCGSSMKYE